MKNLITNQGLNELSASLHPYTLKERSFIHPKMVTSQLQPTLLSQPGLGAKGSHLEGPAVPLRQQDWQLHPPRHSQPCTDEGTLRPPQKSLLCRNMDSPPLTSCKEDVAWSQSPFISLPGCFQLLASALAMSHSVCRAPYISLQKINLRQRREAYLALMVYRVSFFYLNLLLFNELNSHWMN